MISCHRIESVKQKSSNENKENPNQSKGDIDYSLFCATKSKYTDERIFGNHNW